MKDWVATFIQEKDACLYSSLKQEFEKSVGINFIDIEKYAPHQQLIRGVAELLAEEIYHNFDRGVYPDGTIPDQEKSQRFLLMFSSVLSDLEESIFRHICDSKNLFVSYRPPIRGYTQKFKIKSEIQTGASVFFLVFENELGNKNFSWLVGRGIIIHELVHAIKNERSDKKVHQICREWGFSIETDVLIDYLDKEGGIEKEGL